MTETNEDLAARRAKYATILERVARAHHEQRAELLNDVIKGMKRDLMLWGFPGLEYSFEYSSKHAEYQREINTKYEDLSEGEKQIVRARAEEILTAIGEP